MSIRSWLGLDALRRDVDALAGDISGLKTAPRASYDDGELWDAIKELSDRLDEMRHAVAEGIERVDRSERRIKQTVRRAREKLEAAGFTDDGVEAEAEQLQLLDGRGSGEGGMQHMPSSVGAGRPDLSAFPGVWGDAHVAAILRARG